MVKNIISDSRICGKSLLRTGAAVLALAVCFTSYGSFESMAAAEGPREPSEIGKTQAELNGYSEEQWAGLMDDIIGWDELKDLVHCFNPNIASAWDSYEDSHRDTRDSYNILKQTEEICGENLKEAQAHMDPQDPNSIAAVAMHTAGLQTSRTVAASFKSVLNGMEKGKSYKLPIEKAENQVVQGARLLMLAYRTAMSQKETLQTLSDMYAELAAVQGALVSQGMATAYDVMKAQNDLMSAQSSISSFAGTEKKLYDQLTVMCGYAPGSSAVIGQIPDPDPSAVDRMDPDRDITAACGNNDTLIEVRRSKAKGQQREFKAESEEQMEAGILINLRQYKADAEAARQGYSAAQAGYQAARISADAAQLQYDMGLINRAQYLGLKIQYLQKKAAMESAGYNLTQAIITYDAAVGGICPTE